MILCLGRYNSGFDENYFLFVTSTFKKETRFSKVKCVIVERDGINSRYFPSSFPRWYEYERFINRARQTIAYECE